MEGLLGNPSTRVRGLGTARPGANPRFFITGSPNDLEPRDFGLHLPILFPEVLSSQRESFRKGGPSFKAFPTQGRLHREHTLWPFVRGAEIGASREEKRDVFPFSPSGQKK